MVELIDYIDLQIKDCITGIKQFGLCHLIEGDNEKFPATVEEPAMKAIPDSRFLLLSYHRLLNGAYEVREDLSFGKKLTPQNRQRVRMVVFIKLNESQNLIDDIFNAMPGSFEVDDYLMPNVTKTAAILRDRQAIWNDEFGAAYKDKFQQVWQIFAIEYDLQYIKCNVCV